MMSLMMMDAVDAVVVGIICGGPWGGGGHNQR